MCTAVPTSLLELQMQLRQAVLGADAAEIVATIAGDGLDPAARLGIYRNHAFATLGAALQGTFPVICRLVDERFFAYAAHEYVRQHPPHSRCLSEYGADFPDFLAGFEPCKDLVYLADVAGFEWALNITASMRETASLQIEALAGVPVERAAYVALRLQPSVSYVASHWPIDAIWQANQQDEVPPTNLSSGGAALEIRRAGDKVVWRRLDPAAFAFRATIADGRALAAAITAATQRDFAFDIISELQQVFGERLAVALCVPPEETTI